MTDARRWNPSRVPAAFSLVVASSLLFSASAAGQFVDRTFQSAVGGSMGGLGGIILALPAGCGGIFSNRVCRLPALAKGFGAGNILGSAFGAAQLGKSSSCVPVERLGRALIGTLAGAGVGVGVVSRAHDNLRIALSPLVQLAEGVGAAGMLGPCKYLGSVEPDSAAHLLPQHCRGSSAEIVRDASGVALAGGYAALHAYFNHEWWSSNPAKPWFVANDWDQNERDEDKLGHLFGGYHLTRLTSEVLQAGCVAPSRAVMLGALYAWMIQFQIEEWDGTQKIYGFNPSDLIADAAGAMFAVGQQHNKMLRYIKPVFSYRPTEAYRRRNEPGHLGQPRATTDYAGQTYWLSTDVHSLLPDGARVFWPAFIRLSPGYSITNYLDPATGAPLRAKRRFLLSLDLDPERLPGDNKVWRVVKHELSFFRIPGPAIQLTPDRRFFLFY